MSDSTQISIISKPSPFRAGKQIAFGKEGETLSEMLDATGIEMPLYDYCVATVNGDVIPREHWRVVRPKKGTIINFTIVPHGGGGGGGGKSPLRTILSIAVIAASFYVPVAFPGLASSISSGLGIPVTGIGGISSMAIGKAILGGIVTLVGNALVNAIAPPASPNRASGALSGSVGSGAPVSPTLAITGTRNRANQFGVQPRIYGRHRMFPLYAGQPYTEEIDGDQHLFVLFDFGYGPLALSDLKIGTNDLSKFEGVELEIREGYATDEPHTLYRNTNLVDSYSILVSQSGGAKIVTSRANTDELYLDITFRGLVEYNSSGNRTSRTVEATIEYRDADVGGAWTSVVAGDGTEEVATGATKTTPTDGTKYIDYTLDNTVSSGGISTMITVPTSYAGATIHSMKHAVYTREVGQTNWTRQFQDTDWQLAGTTIDYVLSVANDRIIEVRVEQIGLALASGTWDGLNDSGSGYEAVPNVSFSYNRRVVGNSSFTDDTNSQSFRTINIKPGAPARYEVRVTRITADSDSSQILDEMSISGLRSVQYVDPISFDEPHCTVAMRIKATDQLNGVIDSFNAVATSILPVWDGNSWTDTETRNAAWAFVDVLRGTANKNSVADSRIDLDAMVAWAAANDAQAPQSTLPDGVAGDVNDPYWTCDLVVDYETTVWEVLGQIASTSRAAPGMVDGKFSIVRDVEQSTPVQVITPRNSWGFKATKTFIDVPHALRVKYTDPERDWKTNEVIVYDDGFSESNATEFQEMDTIGITNRGQAWREGRYQIAVGRLRNETFQVQMDIENLVCSRGDLVELAHDVPAIGGEPVRVDEITVDVDGLVTDVTFDGAVNQVAGSNVIRTRRFDGSVITNAVVDGTGEKQTVTLSVATPQDQAPTRGDLCVFGPSTLVTSNYLVKEIEPGPDLTANLTLLPEEAGVYSADTGAIESDPSNDFYDPEIDLPTAVTLSITQETRVVNRRYVYAQTVEITPAVGVFYAGFEIYTKNGAGAWQLHSVTQAKTVKFENLDGSKTYSYLVRGLNTDGQGLPIADSAQITQEVVRTLPASVTTFSADIVDNIIQLTWEQPDPATDVDFYEIRYSPLTSGASWNDGLTISTSAHPSTTESLRASSGTYMIKSETWDNYESATEATVVTTVPDNFDKNIVATVTEHSAFTGTKTNTEVVSGALRLAETGGIYESSGSYEFAGTVDLGAVYTSLVSASVTATVFGASQLFDSANGTFDDAVGNFDDSGLTVGSGGITVYVAYKDTAVGSGTWGAWEPLVAGQHTARSFKFKVDLSTIDTAFTPSITALVAEVDMPDRFESNNNVSSSSSASTSISFSNDFYATPAIGLTVDNLAAGDYWTITNQSVSGFDVDVYNSGGTRIVRTFDWIARGGGKVPV